MTTSRTTRTLATAALAAFAAVGTFAAERDASADVRVRIGGSAHIRVGGSVRVRAPRVRVR
ncbi:MAG: hypothetical protein KC464_06680, partial [Myxococcales bacterium]|nr:hypothetical protein [Myxococcales bacterium]